MTTKDEALKQALDALLLKYSDVIYDGASPDKAGEFEQDVGDLIAALAEQDSEPVVQQDTVAARGIKGAV